MQDTSEVPVSRANPAVAMRAGLIPSPRG